MVFQAEVCVGDAKALIQGLAENSIDAVITDPPYELKTSAGRGFMGQAWDGSGVAFNVDLWEQVLRALKPGGMLAAFGSPRTWHRLAVAIEDAGFEIRDSIAWIHAQGMPHGLDLSKAADKKLGGVRKQVGVASDFARDGFTRKTDGGHQKPAAGQGGHGYQDRWSAPVTMPATSAAKQLEGWNSSLKPAMEPIVIARKPFKGALIDNVLTHGVGGINVGACRIGDADIQINVLEKCSPHGQVKKADYVPKQSKGRYPTNVVFTHHEDCEEECHLDCQIETLNQQAGLRHSGANPKRRNADKFRTTYRRFGGEKENLNATRGQEDNLASAFFPTFRFQSKASTRERPKSGRHQHTTVKPLDLMRWLTRLITPTGGVVLDPFAGSGTGAEAALLENMHFVGFEQDPKHLELVKIRMDRIGAQTTINTGKITAIRPTDRSDSLNPSKSKPAGDSQ